MQPQVAQLWATANHTQTLQAGRVIDTVELPLAKQIAEETGIVTSPMT
jgi:hypothetical protein